MKKIIAIILTVTFVAGMITACAKKEEPETTTAPQTTSETETTAETTTQTTSSTTKKDTKPFEKWDVNDLADYFKKEKVFTEKEYLGIYTNVEELPTGVSGEIEYNNHENDEINVLIFYFDKNTKDKKVEELYNKIKKDKYFEWEDGGRNQPFNALIGRFAIFYSASVDENYIKSFEKALDKLIKDENLKPDFYEKNLDLTKYKADDDVIIIEADD